MLTHIHTSSYPPEDEITKQDDKATQMYFLSLGECEVLVKDHHKKEEVVKIVTKGDLFGEVALIANCKRTATVRGLNYCTLASIKSKDFTALLTNFPSTLTRFK